MQNACIPLYNDADEPISVRATAPVVGKTFADISGDITSGPGLTFPGIPGTYDGSNFRAATCAAGKRAIGVFGADGGSGDLVPLLVGAGLIVPVTAGGAVTAGDELQVGANGKAVTAVAAAASLELGAGNSKIKFTAKDAGYGGNGISVQLKNPAANSQALGVVVNGNDIVVNLATDAGGVITSTVTQIIAAIVGSAGANSLVVAASGTGSDGTGVVVAAAATNLAGGADVAGVAVAKAFTTAASGADCFARLY